MAALKKNDKAILEAEFAASIINTYPSLQYQSPVSWIGCTNNYDRPTTKLLDVCHGAVARAPQRTIDMIFTSFPAYAPIDFRYFEFLKNHLFHQFRDRIELVESDIEITKNSLPRVGRDNTEDWQGKKWHYLKLTKLDTWPANVLYNFCIASRTVVEWRNAMEAWDRMVLIGGVNPGLAWRLCLSIYQKTGASKDYWQNGFRSYARPDFGAFFDDPGAVQGYKIEKIGHVHAHWAQDTSNDVRLMVEGAPDPTKFAKLSYKEHPGSSTPTTAIWGNIGRKAETDLLGKTIQEISEFYGLPLGQAPIVRSAKEDLFYLSVPEQPKPVAAVEAPNRAARRAVANAIELANVQLGAAPGWGAAPPPAPAPVWAMAGHLAREALADAVPVEQPMHVFDMDDLVDDDDDDDDMEDRFEDEEEEF